jgi:hypothetical protein
MSHDPVFERVYVPLCPILPRYVDEYLCRYKDCQEDAPLNPLHFLSIFWRSPRRGGLPLSISAEMCPKLDLARQGALDVDSTVPLGRIHPALGHEIKDADIQSGQVRHRPGGIA